MLRLDDATLVQHIDHDGFARLIDADEPDVIGAVNRTSAELLAMHGSEAVLWDVMAPGGIFHRDPSRLDRWLERTQARRVVHGHKPHDKARPDAYHGGRAVNFDGRLSRYYGQARFRRTTPLGASVAPL